MDKDFRTLKAELDAMKCSYLGGGTVTYDQLKDKAALVARSYNEAARVIAKKYGKRRPPVVTATGLLR